MSTDEKFTGWLGLDSRAADGKMVWGEFTPKQWEETDVDIRITHCGVCGTDMHTLRSGWVGVFHFLSLCFPWRIGILKSKVLTMSHYRTQPTTLAVVSMALCHKYLPRFFPSTFLSNRFSLYSQLAMKLSAPQSVLGPKLSETFKSVTALGLVPRATHVYLENRTAKNATRGRKNTAPTTGPGPTIACS